MKIIQQRNKIDSREIESPTSLPLIVGITGASGVIYGLRLLEILRDLRIDAHLVMSKAAERTFTEELDMPIKEIRNLAKKFHPVTDIGASISSGSFRTQGMVILPCSVRTMSEISTGVTSSLMSRAADVVLKERRKLVLAVRETPLHLGHLCTMQQLARMGAIIAPPVPAFYHKPQTLDDIIDQTVGRLLDLFDINNTTVKRWKSNEVS